MPKAVLSGLKNYPIKISVICSMFDSGGSSGRLRKEFGILSPGDIRRSLITFSNVSPQIKEVFNFRFQKGELKGHNFGNLLITDLWLTTKNFKKTIKEIRKILNIKEDYQVFPVSLDNSNLYAILENDRIISGETNIDIPKHNKKLKIKKTYLKPKAKIYPEATRAIKNADLIIIGPGDLYSTISQIFLTGGILKAIKKSKAKKVYICNLMTKNGETNKFSVLDFTKEIEKYLKEKLDYIIYNNFFPDKNRLKKYKNNHPEFIELVKVNKGLSSKKFIGKNLLLKNGPIEHESKKISKILISLL